MRKNNLARGCMVAELAASVAFAGGSAMYAQSATAIAPSPALRWDVISVKPISVEKCAAGGGIRHLPDGLSASCVPVSFMVQVAYRLMNQKRIVGLPAWANGSSVYAIDARVSGEDAQA